MKRHSFTCLKITSFLNASNVNLIEKLLEVKFIIIKKFKKIQLNLIATFKNKREENSERQMLHLPKTIGLFSFGERTAAYFKNREEI